MTSTSWSFAVWATRRNRPAGTLGLLDLKRLEMARALSLHPRVLFLDEVGAGLVAHETEQMIDIVRKVHAEGVALMIVEHVEAVIRELAQRIIVIDWGKVVAHGTPEEVAADPTVRSIYLGEGTHAGAQPGRAGAGGRRVAAARSWTGSSPRYGKAVALDGVSLRVQQREVVSVLGANGAGKTTMTRVITGLLPVAAGEVRMSGTVLNALPPHRRLAHGVACCPEGRRIFGELTVHENLMLGGFTLGSAERAARAEELCALFPVLARAAHRSPQARSAAASSSCSPWRGRSCRSPRLLILDEASLGLSPVAVDTVFQAIADIRDAGTSVLLIEQNAHRSLSIADHAYVLDRGRITYDGPARELDDPDRLSEAYFGARR